MAQTPVAGGGNAGLLSKGGTMPDTPVPWVGLVALAAMFLLPLLPDWLFEGPRTSKHWPRRHICGDCGAPRTDEQRWPPVKIYAGTILSFLPGRLYERVLGERAGFHREEM
jgi:hypothetical protein